MDQDKRDSIVRALIDPRDLPFREQQRLARTHTVKINTSPRRIEGAGLVARPLGRRTADGIKPQIVTFSDRKLVCFDDGSFRNVPRRRRFGVSGRQLRMARKAARRDYHYRQRLKQDAPPVEAQS